MKPKVTVPTPLRYCVSCAVTLFCWALWLVLGAALAAQAYVWLVKDVPVPGLVLRRIEAELAAQNFTVRFGRAHFDPTGRLLLEDVQLFLRSYEEPVFASRLAYTEKSLWSVLSGRLLPDEIRFEGATLQLPAMYSPSGTAEPLLREMAGTLHFVRGACVVDQLACHVGNVAVTVHGVVSQPRSARGAPLSAEAIVGRFLQYGRKIALLLPQLEAAERPALAIETAPRPQGGMNVTLEFAADAVRRPAGLAVDAGRIAAVGHWSWDGIRPHATGLHVWLRDVAGPKGLAADDVRGSVVLEPPDQEFATLSRLEAHVAAGAVQALGEDWTRPVVSATYDLRDGRGRFAAAVKAHGELLAAAGDASLRSKSAAIALSGRVAPGLVSGLLTRYGPKLEPYFRFGDPVDLTGRIELTDGWKFGGFWSHVAGGRLDSHGVQVTSTRGAIDVDSQLNFLAHDALVVAGENEARGSYWMNFRSFDYRMLLIGRLRPLDINGWFRGDWWAKFWQNFSFPDVPAQADVDVQGCWKAIPRTSYFGSTDAVKPVVLGADLEKVHVRIFVRPQFADVMDLAAERAGGTQQASGWFRRLAGPPGMPTALDYDVKASLEPAIYAKAGGVTAAKLLAAWQFDRPPEVHVAGHTDWGEGQLRNDLRFTANSPAGLRYSGFPLDAASVDGAIRGDELRLDRIEFQFAGGKGRATASLNGAAEARRLAFDGTLKEADLARTILAVENFEAARTGAKSASITESKFIKRASGGKLELTLAAQGSPGDPASLRGSGSAQLTGAELGEIHLFGLLSQVLSAVALNFSSLKLDAARTSFQLDNGRVHFPDVRITGPSAVIDAKGDYLFASKSLDFTAKLKPYEESRNPLTAVVGIVINPLTSIFELRLTGPLAKPSWSVVLGPGPKPDAPAPAEEPAKPPATPPPPAGGR